MSVFENKQWLKVVRNQPLELGPVSPMRQVGRRPLSAGARDSARLPVPDLCCRAALPDMPLETRTYPGCGQVVCVKTGAL